jgi:RNA polymerase sigma-70 factor (ECF subfamily)
MEDTGIVDLFLKRDEAAIRETAAKYGASLRRIAAGVLGDPLSAEECENDTYLQAWNSIPPHEPRDYLFPFLARITRHIAIDRCRREAAQKRTAQTVELTREMAECLPAGADGFDAPDAHALTEAINRFLAALPETQRTLFLRRYWYFDSVADAARYCGVSLSKAKTTLFRLREKLRVFLEKEGYTV